MQPGGGGIISQINGGTSYGRALIQLFLISFLIIRKTSQINLRVKKKTKNITFQSEGREKKVQLTE